MVSHINKMYEERKITWNAQVYDEFKDMTFEEINMMSGIRRNSKARNEIRKTS